ncbi:MAG: putative lipid II flippase FtsW [Deltaproteobacteria bacterium]|nr:putative lipid II flippase FtsW [Deltaproteobacteria bacterium]
MAATADIALDCTAPDAAVDYSGRDQTLLGAAARPPKSDKALVKLPVGMDWLLLGAIFALMTTGVVMAYSASVYASLHQTRNLSDTVFLNKHLVHAAAGVTAVLIGAHVPYQMWRRVAYALLVLTIGLLVATLMVGVVINKARRWLPLPGFMFQPAELGKFAFAVYLAHSLTKKISTERVHTFTVGFLPHAVVWMVVFALCMKQPDLGTGIVLAVLLFSMTYVAGLNVAYLLFLGLAGAAGLGVFILHSPMRFKRFLAFLDPLLYRDTTGFQLFNGKLAVATGGLFGNGLGLSRQKLGFVPECHTDFILSIIAEELGLIGVALVALLFIVFLLRGLRIALHARDEFGRLLAAGITVLFGTQAAVNFGVVMGTLPTKGLTLPFVSHGGSSLVVMGLAAGVLLNIGRGGNPDLDPGEPSRLWAWLRRDRAERPANQRSGAQRAVAPLHAEDR